jgi:glycerate 2-kinase
MTRPIEGATLSDLVQVSQLLLSSGADIKEINTVRKHLCDVKGGKVARLTKGKVLTLVLSDVIGDPMDIIASGPTTHDRSTWHDVRAVVLKYGLGGRLPPGVVTLIDKGVAGQINDTPKRGDKCFDGVTK